MNKDMDRHFIKAETGVTNRYLKKMPILFSYKENAK